MFSCVELSNVLRSLFLLLVVLCAVTGSLADNRVAEDSFERAKKLLDANNYSDALPLLTDAAEAGNARAQCELGTVYLNGTGVAQNYGKALHWYEKAANQGDSLAQSTLGVMYIDGMGVSQSDSKAVEWFQKSADQGLAEAEYNLGAMYRAGRGVQQSDSKAVEWYQKAASQGDPDAECALGNMYKAGRGVQQSDSKAVEWYQKAASQGNARAQQLLGSIRSTVQRMPNNETRSPTIGPFVDAFQPYIDAPYNSHQEYRAKSVLLSRLPTASTEELTEVMNSLPPNNWLYPKLYFEISRRGADPLGKISDAQLVEAILNNPRNSGLLMMEFVQKRLPKMPNAQIIQLFNACPPSSGLRIVLAREIQRREGN